MDLPVLFKHVSDGLLTAVARTRQYEVKAQHFLVDVADDAKVFVEDKAFQLVAEGVAATEKFAELGNVKADEKPVDAKTDSVDKEAIAKSDTTPIEADVKKSKSKPKADNASDA